MSGSFSSERRRAGRRMACLTVAMLAVYLFAGNSAKAQDASQDVAAAARQERARKAAPVQGSSHESSHVYTNEDLRRAQILRDRKGTNGNASLDAREREVSPSENASVKASSAGDVKDIAGTESLGEVARRYRREKAAREAERASKLPDSSPFHMEVPQPALAEIAPRRALMKPSAVRAEINAAIDQATDKASGKKSVPRIDAWKRDPFARPTIGALQRPAKAPIAPVAVIASPNRLIAIGPRAIPPVVSTSEAGKTVALAAAVAPKMVAPAPRKVFATPTLAVAPIRSLPSSRRAAPISSGVTVALRPGDSLWKLSRRYLGSGARWREWLSSNSEIGDPRQLPAGLTLVVPQKTEKRSSSGPAALSSCSSFEVVVRSGDSLWKISAAHYSRGALWPCVAQANAGALRGNEMIYPGQVLLLPAACGAGATPLRFAAR